MESIKQAIVLRKLENELLLLRSTRVNEDPTKPWRTIEFSSIIFVIANTESSTGLWLIWNIERDGASIPYRNLQAFL